MLILYILKLGTHTIIENFTTNACIDLDAVKQAQIRASYMLGFSYLFWNFKVVAWL